MDSLLTKTPVGLRKCKKEFLFYDVEDDVTIYEDDRNVQGTIMDCTVIETGSLVLVVEETLEEVLSTYGYDSITFTAQILERDGAIRAAEMDARLEAEAEARAEALETLETEQTFEGQSLLEENAELLEEEEITLLPLDEEEEEEEEEEEWGEEEVEEVDEEPTDSPVVEESEPVAGKPNAGKDVSTDPIHVASVS